MIKYSIIVPIFNVEQYLSQCIESVLSQSYTHYELILVDDGSTDGCPRLCDIYAQDNGQIRVIHQKNAGVAEARNAGIRTAKGDYIIFLDADDYWDDLDALYDINNTAQNTNTDVIVWRNKKRMEGSGRIIRKPGRLVPDIILKQEKSKALRILIETEYYDSSPCNKAVKRYLFLKNDLSFEKNVRSEDVEWVVRLAICSRSFALCPACFYVYRQWKGSATKNITERFILDMKKHFIDCHEHGKKVEDIAMREALMGYVAAQYVNLLVLVSNSSEKRSYLPELKKYEFILDSAITGRSLLIKRAKDILGLTFVLIVLHWMSLLLKYTRAY